MHDLQIFAGSDVVTMSSIEIAEYTKKEHKHVLRDIRNMLSELGLDGAQLWSTQTYGNNNTREVCNLDKEFTLTLVSGYNIKMRNAIIKRWQELESKVPALPQDYPSALRALADSAERLIESEREVQSLTTERDNATVKVKVLEKVMERHDCKTLTELLEGTGVSARVANKELEALGYLFTERVSGKNRKRLTERGEMIAKEFPSKKFVQIGILPDKEEEVLDMVLGV